MLCVKKKKKKIVDNKKKKKKKKDMLYVFNLLQEIKDDLDPQL